MPRSKGMDNSKMVALLQQIDAEVFANPQFRRVYDVSVGNAQLTYTLQGWNAECQVYPVRKGPKKVMTIRTASSRRVCETPEEAVQDLINSLPFWLTQV